MKDLTDAAILPLKGYCLIEASAGTGKTFTITSIYLRLVMEEGLGPEEILVVTFTNAATQELRSKVRQRLGHALSWLRGGQVRKEADDALHGLMEHALSLVPGGAKEIERRLRSAILGMDQASIYTIHGFCQRVLKEFAFEAGVHMEQREIVKDSDLHMPACREFIRSRLSRMGSAYLQAVLHLFSGSRGLPEAIIEDLKGLLGIPEPLLAGAVRFQEADSELRRFQALQRGMKPDFEQVRRLITEHYFALAEDLFSCLEGEVSKKALNSFRTALTGKRGKLTGRLKSDFKGLETLLAELLPETRQFDGVEGAVFLKKSPFLNMKWLKGVLEEVIAPDGTVLANNLKKAAGPVDIGRIQHVSGKWMADQERLLSFRPGEAQTRLVQGFRERSLSLLTHRGIRERIKASVLCEAREFITSETRRIKERLGAVSYDDMLVMLKEALSSRPGERIARLIRRRWPVALIDEFQDTDVIQWQIFRTIYPHPERSRLFLIGDPKQAIYGFRGADIFTYLRAKETVPEGRRYNLGTNWRSSPELVEVINRLFQAEGSEPFGLKGIDFLPADARSENGWRLAIQGEDGAEVSGKAVEFWLCFHEGEQEAHGGADSQKKQKAGGATKAARGKGTYEAQAQLAQAAACEISKLVELGRRKALRLLSPDDRSRPVAPGDIAVLVRSHKQARLIQDALDEYGVCSIYWGPSSVFTSNEARELLYILNGVLNPSDLSAVSTALGTAALGYTADEISALKRAHGEWDRISEAFMELRGQWHRQGVLPMLRALFNRFGVQKRLHGLSDGARRLTNLRQLAELLSRAEQEHSGMERLLLWLSRSMEEPDRDADEQRLRLETDENLVQIRTYHMSKGLEFPIVFLPFLEGMKGVDRPPSRGFWKVYSMAEGAYVCHLAEPYHDGGDGSSGQAPGRDAPAGTGGQAFTGLEEAYLEQGTSEELRLIYVALTRAKYKLYIPFSSADSFRDSLVGRLVRRRYGELLADQGGEEPQPRRMLERVFADCSGLEIRSVSAADIAGPQPGKMAGQRQEAEIVLPSLPERGPLVRQTWARASFSSVSAAGLDHGLAAQAAGPFLPGMPEGLDIFSFPRGAAAGECVHRLLETADFTWGPKELEAAAAEVLEEAGFPEKWAPVLAETAAALFAAEIAPGLRLKELPQAWTAREMEFHWPFSGRLVEEIPELGRYCKKGVMKGYIDLFFRHGDRFYLLDYKTNWLGPSAGHYHQAAMKEAMDQHGYWLQAAIYARAVHLFLEASAAGYEPAEHFGGAFYLFIRGLSQDGSTGVVFISPDEMARRCPWVFGQDI